MNKSSVEIDDRYRKHRYMNLVYISLSIDYDKRKMTLYMFEVFLVPQEEEDEIRKKMKKK